MEAERMEDQEEGPVLNQDLWNELDQLLSEHQPSYRWVKGGTDRMWKTTDAIRWQRKRRPNAGKDQGFDYVYERLSGFNARTARPLSKPLIQCREDHEAMIASELVWSDSVSTDEYA
jgi:hypothetical protein